MSRKPTLHDVARAAGVSASTVSKHLSNTGRTSAETAARIDQAIQDLGYLPNVVARGLVQGQAYSIGVITQDIASPFYGAALLGVQDALEGTPYAPFYMDGRWSPADEDAALRHLRGRVDGMVVMGGLLDPLALAQHARRIPMICIGRLVPGFEQQCVLVDNHAGARLAMQVLLEQGHTQIAHIAGPPFQPDAMARLQGYSESLQEAGLPVLPELIEQGTFMEPSGAHAVNRLLEKKVPFTAIFAANDAMAFGARLALHRHGLQVPGDVSLIGFDDGYTSAFMMPPLTTIQQPMHELGHLAGQSILRLLHGETVNLQQIQPRLVLRESVARPGGH